MTCVVVVTPLEGITPRPNSICPGLPAGHSFCASAIRTGFADGKISPKAISAERTKKPPLTRLELSFRISVTSPRKLTGSPLRASHVKLFTKRHFRTLPGSRLLPVPPVARTEAPAASCVEEAALRPQPRRRDFHPLGSSRPSPCNPHPKTPGAKSMTTVFLRRPRSRGRRYRIERGDSFRLRGNLYGSTSHAGITSASLRRARTSLSPGIRLYALNTCARWLAALP